MKNNTKIQVSQTLEVSQKKVAKAYGIKVSGRTHQKVARLAKKSKKTMMHVANELVIAGLKSIGM